MNAFDFYLFQKINSLAGNWPWLDILGIFFAKYFGYILVFSLFLFFLKNWKKYWLVVVQALAAAIFARFLLVQTIRWVWPRSRPFVENNINLLLDKIHYASFPSGHTAFFFALSTVIFLYYRKVYPASKLWCGASIFFFSASFLISLSRVFSGVHWPSDILAGIAVGLFSGWLIVKLVRKF
jgi:undecaprenyl-diphosphatase